MRSRSLGVPVSSWRPVLVALGLVVAGLNAACVESTGNATAVTVSSRAQLIGGPRATGDVGDFKLSNGIIQAVVQNVGHARSGTGAFGGALIDLDLARGSELNTALGAAGNDHFSEFAPAFFGRGFEPVSVEVAADGSDGRAAIVRVTGRAAPLLFTPDGARVDEVSLPSNPEALTYVVDYVLEPNEAMVSVVTTVTNAGATGSITFPQAAPYGFALTLGETQKPFVAGGGGFDLRNQLGDSYDAPPTAGALPGAVGQMLLTEGVGTSYGFFVDAPTQPMTSYLRVASRAASYPTSEPDSMLLPFGEGGNIQAFWVVPPERLGAGESFRFVSHIVVGSGTVDSAARIGQEQKRLRTGRLAGRIWEAGSHQTLSNVLVTAEDDTGRMVSSTRSTTAGVYAMAVPPGRYRIVAVDNVRGRVVAPAPNPLPVYVEVTSGGDAQADATFERAGWFSIRIRDGGGRPLPAKVSIVGRHAPSDGLRLREFLYDLRAGERFRPSDLVNETEGSDAGREFLEATILAPNGQVGRALRPGAYKLYVSRGSEYGLFTREIEIGPGQEQYLEAILPHQMPTPGFVSADLHVHSVLSNDSSLSLEDRVAGLAAEGIEYVVPTEHNVVADYQPTVERLGLQDWLRSTTGVEATTLDMGHFSAFPVRYLPEPMAHGAPDWYGRTPGDLFTSLRAMGEGDVVLQATHPTERLTGYFSAFGVNGYTGESLVSVPGALTETASRSYAAEDFSLDFDGVEVLAGKRQELVHHYRVPESPGEGANPTAPIPSVGEILEERVTSASGQVVRPVYPGVLDTILSLAAKGKALTALGGSDSHSANSESGVARTYVHVGDAAQGSMRSLRDADVVAAIRRGAAVVTNGPFIELTVNGQPVGSNVSAPNGRVRVQVRVSAPDWMEVREAIVHRGGPDQDKTPFIVRRIPLEVSGGGVRGDATFELDGLPAGSFIVAEVTGARSMWPVYVPLEVPALQPRGIVGVYGPTAGVADPYGRYRPREQQVVKPFAVTNPVWINR